MQIFGKFRKVYEFNFIISEVFCVFHIQYQRAEQPERQSCISVINGIYMRFKIFNIIYTFHSFGFMKNAYTSFESYLVKINHSIRAFFN